MNNTTDLTFIQLFVEYKEFLFLKNKYQSFRKRMTVFDNHILPYFGNYKLKDINNRVYIDFMNKIQKKSFKYSYNKFIHGEMVTILNYAVKFGYIDHNIALLVGGFNKSKSKRKVEMQVWDFDEFNQFIDVVDDYTYKVLFETLFYTGLRIGECLALNWNDFICDGSNYYLDVNKTLTKDKDKKGNYIFNSPKTDCSIRRVYIDDLLVNSLKKVNALQCKKRYYNDDWFIFGGIKPLSQSTVGRRKDNYCDIAGVKKIRLHDFRHSHATLLISANVPISAVSKRLGHSTISQTLDTYTHLLRRDELQTIATINKIHTKQI